MIKFKTSTILYEFINGFLISKVTTSIINKTVPEQKNRLRNPDP